MNAISLKLVCALTGCASVLFSGTSAHAQLMGLTEEEYIQQHGVSPVTGKKVEQQKPRPSVANDNPATANNKPAAAVSGRLGELQNRSILTSCIPLSIYNANLQGGLNMENCVQLRGIDVIGSWDGTGRSARWKVSAPRSGNYNMVVLYSFLHLNDGNKPFRIFVDGQTRHWSTVPAKPSHFPATTAVIEPAFHLSPGERQVGVEALHSASATLWLVNAYLIPENACSPGTVVLHPACGTSVGMGRFYHDRDVNFVLGGHFNNPGDGLSWEADIPEPGKYLVEIEYSNRRYREGRRMRLSIDRNNDLYWKLPYTEPTSDMPRPFNTQLVDVVSLSRGKHRLTVALDEKGYYALDLFQVRLVPIDEKTAARLGCAVSLSPAPRVPENKASSSPKETKPQQQIPAKDFPELHEPPPYFHILQEHSSLVRKDSENLRKRFLAALEKMRDNSVKESNFAAVARIHALIVHTREGGAPPKDLPPNLKRALDAYQFRREKLYYDAKLGYLDALEAMQKSLVSRNDFDQVARIQTYVEQVQTQSPEQLFSKNVAEGGVYMPGTWIEKDNDGNAIVVIIIRPDGTCTRYNRVGDTKEPAVLKKITYSQWGSFTVRKKDENVFQFYSFNGPIGTFSFLDKDTFSMPYNGPGIHTRASKQDKPYRLEE